MHTFRCLLLSLVAGVGFSTATMASTLIFNEPANGPDQLANTFGDATDVGPLVAGANIISGGICGDEELPSRCVSALNDPADAIRFFVPAGLELTDATISVVSLLPLGTGSAASPIYESSFAPTASATLDATGMETLALLSGGALRGEQMFRISLPDNPLTFFGDEASVGWSLRLDVAVSEVPLPASGLILLSAFFLCGGFVRRAQKIG